MDDKDKYLTRLNPNTKELEVYDINTGELVWDGTAAVISYKGFDQAVGVAICDLIREGHTIDEICAMPNMPERSLLYSWKRRYPEFGHSMKAARSDRADHFHGKAVSEYKKVANRPGLNKEEYNKSKLVIDYGIKLAEKDSPTEYGSKSTGDNSAPTLVIITGVPQLEKGDEYGETVLGRTRKLPRLRGADGGREEGDGGRERIDEGSEISDCEFRERPKKSERGDRPTEGGKTSTDSESIVEETGKKQDSGES